jgi:hypothetical protein
MRPWLISGKERMLNGMNLVCEEGSGNDLLRTEIEPITMKLQGKILLIGT